jgi:hypothetical protein
MNPFPHIQSKVVVQRQPWKVISLFAIPSPIDRRGVAYVLIKVPIVDATHGRDIFPVASHASLVSVMEQAAASRGAVFFWGINNMRVRPFAIPNKTLFVSSKLSVESLYIGTTWLAS